MSYRYPVFFVGICMDLSYVVLLWKKSLMIEATIISRNEDGIRITKIAGSMILYHAKSHVPLKCFEMLLDSCEWSDLKLWGWRWSNSLIPTNNNGVVKDTCFFFSNFSCMLRVACGFLETERKNQHTTWFRGEFHICLLWRGLTLYRRVLGSPHH